MNVCICAFYLCIVCVRVCLCVSLFVCLSLCLSICASVYLCVFLHISVVDGSWQISILQP